MGGIGGIIKAIGHIPIPIDPGIFDPVHTIGSSTNSIANGIQLSQPDGIGSAISSFEDASTENQLDFGGLIQGNLASDAAMIAPGAFFGDSKNLSPFDTEVAKNLQDPSFEPNSGIQELNTKIQSGELNPQAVSANVSSPTKDESSEFSMLQNAFSQVLKSIGEGLSQVARKG